MRFIDHTAEDVVPAGGLAGTLGAFCLALFVSWSLSWLFLALGARLREEEVMQSIGFLAMLPLMFASPGTAFDARPESYRPCIEAFADSPWQVAMSVGSRTDLAELSEIPPTFDARRSFPAAHRAAAREGVHPARRGSADRRAADARAVGQRRPSRGAGARRRARHDTVTAAELRETVDRVTADPDVRTHLLRMCEVVSSSGGDPAGADAIEAFVG